MEELSLNNPHDHFFKTVFSDPERVRSFLQGALPDSLVKKLDYNSLKLDANSYIDEELQDFYADVVYECVYGGEQPIQLAFLFEHKSYVPNYPHVQLLRYMLSIWEKRIKEKLSLQPIVPLIIYHGKATWKVRSFEEYFLEELPEDLQNFIPTFEYLLINLQAEDSANIRRRFPMKSLQMALLLMKYIRDKKLYEMMEEILDNVDEALDNEQGRIYLKQIFVYL